MRNEEARGTERQCHGVIDSLRDLFAPLLSAHASKTSGFHEFKCPLCHDYKRRAGIRISTTSIGFNCFNCTKKTRYEDGECSIPHTLVQLYEALGGDEHEMNMLKLRLMTQESGDPTFIAVDGVNVFYSPPAIALPTGAVTLERGLLAGEPQAIAAAKYLVDRRKLVIDPSSLYIVPMVSRRSPWFGRVIIPTIMNGKTVVLSGRDITDTADAKYYTEGNKGKAIFNYDIIPKHPGRPLFITEGQFDALRIGGVAVQGNTMTSHQVHWLSSSQRRKVVVPDRGDPGFTLAKQALDLGWEVALPDFGSITDVDAAVVQDGKLYVIEQVLTSIVGGESAEMKVRMYCKGGV